MGGILRAVTPEKPSGWTQDAIEAVAVCLTDDLCDAGPQFSIKVTPLSPSARAITSVPPNDTPPQSGSPGSGGFIEDWHVDGPDALPEEIKRLMGSLHAALGEPAETAIALNVDGDAVMWLEFWSGLDHVEQLADMLDQVQDVVMESTHERWPKCPAHDHELSPRQRGDWVAWECPDTGEAIAQFGELEARLP
jgi:hypothetical protein